MTTTTLRGLKPEVVQAVRKRAAREDKSVNRVLLDLVEQATLGASAGKPRRHHDLDHLFGSLSAADAKILDQVLAEQRTIDKEQWK